MHRSDRGILVLQAQQTPQTRTPGQARRTSKSGSKSGGLSFLERMAQASAKQKSAHNTPRGPTAATRSPAPRNIVRQVKRPVAPPAAPADTDSGPELPEASNGAEEGNEGPSFEEVPDDEEFDEEEEEEDDEEEEEEDDDDAGGDEAPLEF